MGEGKSDHFSSRAGVWISDKLPPVVGIPLLRVVRLHPVRALGMGEATDGDTQEVSHVVKEAPREGGASPGGLEVLVAPPVHALVCGHAQTQRLQTTISY